ncbi:hypothetical protein BS78_01G253000 [Paspalum vaginatum]|nr:hypothetical protein BS78_01G253000 [Paspalum vaginatum]
MALSTIGVCCFCFPPGIGLSALKQLTNQYSAFSRNRRLIQWDLDVAWFDIGEWCCMRRKDEDRRRMLSKPRLLTVIQF